MEHQTTRNTVLNALFTMDSSANTRTNILICFQIT